MKRDAFLRELQKLARRQNIYFDIAREEGKGSHYTVYLGNKKTTIKSGELNPVYVKVLKKQLGL